MNHLINKLVKVTFSNPSRHYLNLTEYENVGRLVKVSQDGLEVLIVNKECTDVDDLGKNIKEDRFKWGSWILLQDVEILECE